ncbi:MAG: hypothetical protein IJL36_09455 [Clostridia bacterium]|nr:hypothetical protein [Clostridia bacterium]
MRIRECIRKILCVATILALAAGPALADGVSLTEMSLALGNSVVRYPAADGIADETLRQAVDEKMKTGLDTDTYLNRMMTLISEESLRIETAWEGAVLGDVISCVVSAEGALADSRSTHRWTWSNIDLRDGHEITLDELFTDGEAAREALGQYLDFEVAPELSAHLANSELTPLPDGFRLERTGLTLLYPVDRLSTLRDRAGAVKIGWNEIREYLNNEEDGIPARIGAAEMITLADESAERIREMAESGRLPDIPVKIGDGLKALTDHFHLLTDPDVYEGGRLFALEGASFRDVFLMTDFLSEKWDDSIVQGIRMDRGCAWGLCVGETAREDWRTALGEPDDETELDGEKAEANRMEPGACDYYNFGNYQLRLYCDEDGILSSIVLAE